MLRITTTARPPGTTVKLEGRVVGIWVDELNSCWRRILASAARPIQIDLDGVTFIDDGGKAVLRLMHADGAVLLATTVMMRAVVEEITARPTGREQIPSPQSRR